MISAIEVKDKTVILRVEGAGSEPRLESSPNLSQWTTENPARSTDAAGVVLTLPAPPSTNSIGSRSNGR